MSDLTPRNNLDIVRQRHQVDGDGSLNSRSGSFQKSSKFKPSKGGGNKEALNISSREGERAARKASHPLEPHFTPKSNLKHNDIKTLSSSSSPDVHLTSSSNTGVESESMSLKRSSSDILEDCTGTKLRMKRTKNTSKDENKENETSEISVGIKQPRSSSESTQDIIEIDGALLPDSFTSSVGRGEGHEIVHKHPDDEPCRSNNISSGLRSKSLNALKKLLFADQLIKGRTIETIASTDHDDVESGIDVVLLDCYLQLIHSRISAIQSEILHRENSLTAACNPFSNAQPVCGKVDIRLPSIQDWHEKYSYASDFTRNSSSGDHDHNTEGYVKSVSSTSLYDDASWVSVQDTDKGLDVERRTVREVQARLSPSLVEETQENQLDVHSVNNPDDYLTVSEYRSEIVKVLKATFGLDNFRPNQLEAINATLEGRDVFVLMPTGGGKSLCYQVPAVCRGGKTDGVTFVVSPLIALMIDQVQHLRARGIDAVLFNSDQGTEINRETRSRLTGTGCKPRLVYVTPEKLQHSMDMQAILKRLYDSNELARFVVDEAHCVSTWGRDFRDAYKDLDRLRIEYPQVPIMALTATANEQVMMDVIDRLRIKGCVLLSQSFNRPNLFYDVRPKKRTVLSDIASYIKSHHPHDTGIIYCLSRNKCEEVAQELRNAHQLRARHYHAQMSPEDKTRAQNAWQKGECEIIVATIAFGMGIDKSNVRYVIHHSLPMSLDGYYQETGRAGRDGKPATCIMYYSYGDTKILIKLIQDGEKTSLEEKKRQEDGVHRVVQYCQNSVDCRRVQLLRFFGQSFNARDCKRRCNNCTESSEVVVENMTDAAKNAVRLTQVLTETGERITRNHCMNVFRGSNLKEIRAKHHDTLPLFGSGRDLARDKIERLFDHLINHLKVIKEYSVQNHQGWNTLYVQVTSQAEAFIAGHEQIHMKFRIDEPKSTKLPLRKHKKTPARSRPISVSKETTSEYDNTLELYRDDDRIEAYENKYICTVSLLSST